MDNQNKSNENKQDNSIEINPQLKQWESPQLIHLSVDATAAISTIGSDSTVTPAAFMMS